MDVFFRAKLFRMLKKSSDYGVLGMFSPDTKTVKMIVVNFGGDVVQHKGKVWIVLKDRIYRHDKPERGINLQRSDIPIKWVEGIPVLYVNETTYLPIDMAGEVGEVKPEEVNSVFSSWVNNQLAKAQAKMLSSFKNQQNVLLIIAVLVVISTGLIYMCYQALNNMQAQLDGLSANMLKIGYKTGAIPVPVQTPAGK